LFPKPSRLEGTGDRFLDIGDDPLGVETGLLQELHLGTVKAATPAARPVSRTGALSQANSGTTTTKPLTWIKEQDLTGRGRHCGRDASSWYAGPGASSVAGCLAGAGDKMVCISTQVHKMMALPPGQLDKTSRKKKIKPLVKLASNGFR
jgi:hypothetical protein